MKIYKLFCLLAIITFCFLPVTVLAQERQIVPTEGYEDGNYTIASFETMIIFVGKAILGLSGTFALVMFVWGGIQMITAAGRSKAFESGRDTVVNALIGLAIILCSYLIINFVLNIVGVKQSWPRDKIDQVMENK